MTDELLTAIQAAEYLKNRVHPGTIRRWAASGRLQTTRLGGRIFFDKKDLDALLTNGNPTSNGKHNID